MKVISARKVGFLSSNYFECKLSCGHEAIAYGRIPVGGFQPTAPKTCKCPVCKK